MHLLHGARAGVYRPAGIRDALWPVHGPAEIGLYTVNGPCYNNLATEMLLLLTDIIPVTTVAPWRSLEWQGVFVVFFQKDFIKMLRLLQWIFLGHCHKWKIIKTINLVTSEDDKVPSGHRYILQCEHCGDIKSREYY